MDKIRLLGVAATFAVAMLVLQGACEAKGGKKPAVDTAVKTISGVAEFKKVVDSSGDRLLLFDLYADWCLPCRVLSPMLEEIAKEHGDKVTVYKVDIAKHQDIAVGLGVTGIPYVVFVKNRTGVHAITGVQPKQAYVRAINILADTDAKKPADTPDGDIVAGVRVVRLSTATTPGDIYVYRGESVRLIVEKVGFPYSMHIPQYDISKQAVVGKDLVVEFKAKDVGVFPVFCNGKCPSGDGARYGQIIVMQYEVDEKFKEVTAKEAKDLIAKSKALVLDVRTPNEYYQGHIKGAKLIPVQQLESRWREIEAHKDKDVLVYCRSGNRSTVASEILVKHGFKKLHNLRHGVKGWRNAGGELVTD